MTLIKKLTRIGNSIGVILPSEILKIAGMDDDAEVEISAKGSQVVLKLTNLKDHRVMKAFMSVLKDHDATLKKLAK